MASAAALALAARLRNDYVRNATGRQADVSGHALLAVFSPDDPMLDFSDPLPSPDGRWIVFADGGEELIARGDGSGARVLVQSFQVGAWSPDSKRLAWLSIDPDANDQLHGARSDGSGDRAVGRGFVHGPRQLVWSHAGRSVRVRTPTRNRIASPDGRCVAAYSPAWETLFPGVGDHFAVVTPRRAGLWRTRRAAADVLRA